MKYLEIRDRGTCVIALAFKFESVGNPKAARMLSAAGYGLSSFDQENYVMLMNISGGNCEAHTDSMKWSNYRTMTTAHRYIEDNYDDIDNGDLIDVQIILSETDTKKASQVFYED